MAPWPSIAPNCSHIELEHLHSHSKDKLHAIIEALRSRTQPSTVEGKSSCGFIDMGMSVGSEGTTSLMRCQSTLGVKGRSSVFKSSLTVSLLLAIDDRLFIFSFRAYLEKN